ncbi:MAG: GNAT family N-acetyltransferase, partial [Pseudomonadota bacterium]
PAMQTNFADWDVVKWIGGIPWPYPPNGAEEYIARRLEDARTREIYYWGIFLEAAPLKLVGAIEYRFFDDEEENRGFWLAQPFWGRGIMTHAVAVTQDFVFFTLEKPSLLVRSLATNAASRAIKEKTGAMHIGTSMGAYHDGEREEDVWNVTRQSWARARRRFSDHLE